MTTVADTRALDAAYRPFPAFAAWQARTTVESPRWSALVTRLKEAKAAAATLTARALEVAKRAAAFDTGAIENLYETDRGFTYSVAFETGAWQLGLTERGEQVRPLFEAQMRAYDLVLDFATGSQPISEAAIRQLHTVVCAAQDTYEAWTGLGWQKHALPNGIYKALPNHVRTRKGEDHAYAPVDMTPQEMHRLVQELRTEDFLAAHPIQQAAYAHYCFVAIHPFADGNGRVARALASLYTYRAASAPIIILSEEKPRYLDALAEADEGKEQSFVVFLEDQAVDTMQLILDELHDSPARAYEDAVRTLKAVEASEAGISANDIDQLGLTLSHAFAAEVQKFGSTQDGFQIASSIEERTSSVARDASLRPLTNNILVVVHVTAEAMPPLTGRETDSLRLLLPWHNRPSESIILMPDDGVPIAFSLQELRRPTSLSTLRLRGKAQKVVAQLVQKLAASAQPITRG